MLFSAFNLSIVSTYDYSLYLHSIVKKKKKKKNTNKKNQLIQNMVVAHSEYSSCWGELKTIWSKYNFKMAAFAPILDFW